MQARDQQVGRDSSPARSLDETSHPVRRLAHRRGLFPGGDFRLGFRLLWSERLCRRTAPAHGWPTSLISPARRPFSICSVRCWSPLSARRSERSARATACWPACLRSRPPRSLIGRVTEPWQLYAAYAVLALGWAGTSLGAITNTLGLWFDHKRGMAISLALNGASFGGIVGVPLLVTAIGHVRICRRHVRCRGVDAGVDGAGDPDLRRPAARAWLASRRRADGRTCLGSRIRAQALRDVGIPDGRGRLRAGAVRAGRLHRSPDLVPRSPDRPRARGGRGRGADGDGGGRAACCSRP